MRLPALAILLLIGLAAAQAPPLPPAGEVAVELTHVAVSGEKFNSTVAFLTLKSNTSRGFLAVLVENGSTRFNLEAGEWTVMADIDDEGTPGKDWTAMARLNLTGESTKATLYYQRVGSLKLLVLEENGAPVEGAAIEIDCVTPRYSALELNGNLKSGAGGALLLQYAPAGTCVINAKKDALAGSATAEVTQGAFIEKTIVLRQQSSPLVYYALLAAGLLAAAVLLYLRFRPNKTPAAPEQDKPAEKKPDGKSAKKQVNGMTLEFAAVYRTLNENEKKIADHLMQQKKRQAKQSKIFAALLIPKTTLIRTIDGMAKKGLLTTQPIGKTRLVELEKWVK